MIWKKDLLEFNEKKRILEQGSDYMYILPHPDLREYISNYTITFLTNENFPENYTILPHGSATLVFEYGNENFHSNLFGPLTKPKVIDSDNLSGILLNIIIEFQPAGFYSFSKLQQSDLTDKIIPFDTIDTSLNKMITTLIKETTSINKLIDNLDALLLENIHTAIHPQLQLILQNIINCAGDITVNKLANNFHYSERQLNRIFMKYVGMSPKKFLKLIRVNTAFRLLSDSHNNITSTSHLAGFHDLSHFIRDFKAICKITPQAYQDNMSDFYSEIAKYCDTIENVE